MLSYEKEGWEQSYRRIAGVDEVGRGCLFGDVVAAAVILPEGLIIDGVNDSKKLTAKKRCLIRDYYGAGDSYWCRLCGFSHD